jgi:hypothetical protein
MSWKQLGRCWGIETGKGESDIFVYPHLAKEALLFCEDCVVKETCLEDGIRNRSIGVWGGTTVGQRPRNPVRISYR